MLTVKRLDRLTEAADGEVVQGHARHLQDHAVLDARADSVRG